MGTKIDLTNQRFGKLLVLEEKGRKYGEVAWLCQCDCGKKSVATSANLRRGNSRSCGCGRAGNGRGARFKPTHGMTGSPEYEAWHAMIRRCENPRAIGWKNYGGRGVKVCDRWRHSSKDFLEDMGRRPSPSHSLDRIDSNGNYTPENCRWATLKEQHRNRRDNAYVNYKGETRCVSEWAETVGMNPELLRDRLRYGWTMERAWNEPVRNKG